MPFDAGSVVCRYYLDVSEACRAIDTTRAALAALADAGLIEIRPSYLPPFGLLSPEERAALAERLRGDRLMSELISEDRDAPCDR